MEPAIEPLLQQVVQGMLAGMAERRVAEVVPHRDRLDQILVEAQRPRHGAGQRGDLQRMGQPGAVVIALRGHEHLRLVLEPPERLRVQDPVAVPLKRGAVRARLLGYLAHRVGGPRRPGVERRLAAELDAHTGASRLIGNTHGPGWRGSRWRSGRGYRS